MPENINRNENRLDRDRGTDENRDPITGAPGAHPVGTGIGAAAGGAAGIAGAAAVGAATGTVLGPAGTIAGAAIGAVVGGLAGKGVAEAVNPTAEEAYWRENYRNEPYYDKNFEYNDYQGAYRTGWEGYSRFGTAGKRYDDVEADLRNDYQRNFGSSKLGWEKAQPAVRAAWHRFDRDLDDDTTRLDPDHPTAAEEMRQRETLPRSQREIKS